MTFPTVRRHPSRRPCQRLGLGKLHCPDAQASPTCSSSVLPISVATLMQLAALTPSLELHESHRLEPGFCDLSFIACPRVLVESTRDLTFSKLAKGTTNSLVAPVSDYSEHETESLRTTIFCFRLGTLHPEFLDSRAWKHHQATTSGSPSTSKESHCDATTDAKRADQLDK